MCAKSKSFFGLRRGSTKSHTYSVLNGQQVTKDRVEGGKNPRTINQSIQRSIFAAAAKFYSLFNFILDHSFQGYAYETPNQSRFMKLALASKLGTQSAKSDPAYPYNYQVSEGSLPSITPKDVDYNRSLGVRSNLAMNHAQPGDESLFDFCSLNNLQAGDNLTIMAVDSNNNAFAITYQIPDDITGKTLEDLEIVREEGKLTPNLDPSADIVLRGIATPTSQAEQYYLTFQISSLLGTIVNGAWILSRKENNVWKRSSEWFFMDSNYAFSSLNGARTYMTGADSVTISSDYQLDTEEHIKTLVVTADLVDSRSGYTVHTVYGGAKIQTNVTFVDGLPLKAKVATFKATYNGAEREYLCANLLGGQMQWPASLFTGQGGIPSMADGITLIPADALPAELVVDGVTVTVVKESGVYDSTPVRIVENAVAEVDE